MQVRGICRRTVQVECRLDELGTQRRVLREMHRLLSCSVPHLRKRFVTSPQRLQWSIAFSGALDITSHDFHSRPKRLQGRDEWMLSRRPTGVEIHLTVNAGGGEHVLVGSTSSNKEPAQKLIVTKEHVRLEQVLVKGVDASANASVWLEPLPRARIDGRTNEIDGRASLPQSIHRASCGVLKLGPTSQPAQQPKLDQQRSRRRRARPPSFARLHAVPQVDSMHRNTSGRVESRQQALAQVLRHAQELPVVLPWRHHAELGVGGNQVGRQQAAEDADGRLEDADGDVSVEAHLLHALHRRLELPKVTQHRQRVEAVDERGGEAAEGIVEVASHTSVPPPPLARQRLQLIPRVRVVHVGVIRVVEAFARLFAQSPQR
mmetsp:Transcript_23317/g.81268  ORF Transcript_23317/g.81268 Transcript_23317/m.81268 type:complete len:375 (-) Transcript_23317:377-1501(-)